MPRALYIQPGSGDRLLEVEGRVGLWKFGSGSGYGIYLYEDEHWYLRHKDGSWPLYTKRGTLRDAGRRFEKVSLFFYRKRP